MGGDEVGLDGESKNAEAGGEVELPEGRVPLRGSALEHLGAPDVVDEHVEVSVAGPDLLRERAHLVGIEMVDGDRDPGATKSRNELGRFFDGLGAVVVRPGRSGMAAASTRANHCCSSFAKRSRDATPSAAGRSRDDGYASTQCISIW